MVASLRIHARHVLHKIQIRDSSGTPYTDYNRNLLNYKRMRDVLLSFIETWRAWNRDRRGEAFESSASRCFTPHCELKAGDRETCKGLQRRYVRRPFDRRTIEERRRAAGRLSHAAASGGRSRSITG
jgi:hypothetical protein